MPEGLCKDDQFGKGFRIALKKAQNLKDQLDEPEVVKVPAFVSEWLTESTHYTLYGLLNEFNEKIRTDKKFKDWKNEQFGMSTSTGVQEFIAKARLYGYETEKEPLYHVQILEEDENSYIIKDLDTGKFEMGSKDIHPDVVADYQTAFTKDEIELMDNGQVLFHTYAEEVDNDN